MRSEASRLYVGNLPFKIDEKEVFEALSHHGEIAEIVIPRRRGMSKGFCFIEFGDEASASSALKAETPIYIQDRKLNIRPASKRV